MKNIFFLLACSAIVSGCCSTRETVETNSQHTIQTTTTITQRDTLAHLPRVSDSIFVQDPYLIQYYENEIVSLRTENDTLRLRLTSKEEQPRPGRRVWKASKVTDRGDTIRVSFTLDSSKAFFLFDYSPAPVKFSLHDTNTSTLERITEEKNKTTSSSDPWYVRLWVQFRAGIVGGILAAVSLAGFMLYRRFIPRL